MRRALLPFLLVTACEVGGTVTVDKGSADDVTTDTDTTSVDDTDRTPVDTDAPDTDVAPDSDTDPVPDATCSPDDGVIGDLSKRGAYEVVTSTGTTQADTCEMSWVRYLPKNATAYPEVVILSHGFFRDPPKMDGWARQFASWGFEVYTPQLCHASPLDADHPANGRDLDALANEVAANKPVVFVGHSAGGLASMLAAKRSTSVIGVLGLDLVDTNNLGKQAAPNLLIPVWGLRGESSACNSNANGRTAINLAPSHRMHVISEASHCDFESPKDGLCSITCPDPWNGKFEDGEQQSAIAALSTAFLFWVTGHDRDGVNYWQTGCPQYDALAATKLVR